MSILNPADPVEAKACVRAAAEFEGPVYLRFGRMAVDPIFDENYEIEIGKGVTLKEGTDVTIVATGLMVGMALEAAETLKAEGISARVINIHTIKPLDKELIINAAKETGAIVTAEEHSVIGGLGGAVTEALAETCPVPVLRVGVEDKFGTSAPAAVVLKAYGLTPETIVEKAKKAISLK
jgi:transketolase